MASIVAVTSVVESDAPTSITVGSPSTHRMKLPATDHVPPIVRRAKASTPDGSSTHPSHISTSEERARAARKARASSEPTPASSSAWAWLVTTSDTVLALIVPALVLKPIKSMRIAVLAAGDAATAARAFVAMKGT